MIESITLRDFQQYKKKTIKFKPGVNCITGPSYAGKSTIFRALRWVSTNKPSVKFNRRKKEWQSKSVSAKLKFDNCSITRTKRTRENEYKVNKKSYKAMGTEVPLDVFKSLRLNHINFQQQLDGPYWFTLPASQVARNLNEIVNLSVIDSVLNKANQVVRDGESEEKVLTKQVHELEEEIAKSKWIVGCRNDWKELESIEADLERISVDSSALKALIEEFHGTRTDTLESFISDSKPLLKMIEDCQKKTRLRKKLNSLIEEYHNSDLDDMLVMVNEFGKLNTFRTECDAFAENRRTLSMYLDEYKENELEIEHWQTRLAQYLKQLETLKLQRCQTCGQVLPTSRKQLTSQKKNIQLP